MPKKGVIPPQLRPFLFKKGKSTRLKVKKVQKHPSVFHMAKRKFRYRSRKVKSHKRRGGMSPIRLVKWVIALIPVSAKAFAAYQANGGGQNGLIKGALPALSTSYTGFNPNDGQFYGRELLWGYAPLIGAYFFGKLASRILR